MKNQIQFTLLLFFYAFMVGVSILGCQKIIDNAPPPTKTVSSEQLSVKKLITQTVISERFSVNKLIRHRFTNYKNIGFTKPVQKRFVNDVNLRAFIIPSKKSTNMKTYCMRCIKKNMGKPIRFLKPYRFTELEIV